MYKSFAYTFSLCAEKEKEVLQNIITFFAKERWKIIYSSPRIIMM